LFIGGSFSEEETYVIKYLVGNELRTKTFKANKMSLIVDGNFQLEKVFNRIYRRSFGRDPVLQDEIISWRVHIPYLPELNATMTREFSTP